MLISKIVVLFVVIFAYGNVSFADTLSTAESCPVPPEVIAAPDEVSILFSYIKMRVPRQSQTLSYALAQSTVLAARQKGVPVAVLAAIQQVESGFHVTATSPKDALGSMQVHYPTWGPQMGLSPRERLLLYIPQVNVPKGTSILVSYLSAENGNLMKAMFRYLGLPDEKLARMSPRQRESAERERLAYVSKIVRAHTSYIAFSRRYYAQYGS